MNVQQVITGALNRGDSTFAVGSIDGLSFTVCAVGAEITILASNFDRIQIIAGNSEQPEVVKAVNCCNDSGKIAAAYQSSIRIFEPHLIDELRTDSKYRYRWTEIQKIELKGPINTVQWVLEGLRLMVVSGDELILYQHKLLSSAVTGKPSVSFGLDEKVSSPHEGVWENVWSLTVANEIKVLKFSPDGTLFATYGKDDCFVKIWYPQGERRKLNFSFIYIQHPAPVCGIEWRRTSRYMPRKSIQNALISWCEDNTSRIWKETPFHDSNLDSLLEAVDTVSREKRKRKHKHSSIKRAGNKLISRLSQLAHRKRAKSQSITNDSAPNLSRSSTFADFAVPATTSTTINFYLAASINAENVPSMDSLSANSKRPFAVHWLNNKELAFNQEVEKILIDALLHDSPDSSAKSDLTNIKDEPLQNGNPAPDEFTPINGISITSPSHQPSESITTESPGATLKFSSQHGSIQDLATVKDVLDLKLESLLRQWNKSYDVLFSVHPVDGSLLTWTVEWLDDTWRQPRISFASRLPNAFPLTDASSLNLSLYTFNSHDSMFIHAFHKSASEVERSSNSIALNSTYQCTSDQLNNLQLLTSHENGSLNLWQLTMDDNGSFNQILNVLHLARMCGHRFNISQVVAHPVLPLLLTASHFHQNALNCSIYETEESELILWKVSPVGPLCKSGGIRELARLTSSSPRTFTCLAWVPAILPSYTLGSVCNSPSSCFVASNHGKLALYQAVVDARGLLSELYSSKGIRSHSSSLSNLSEIDNQQPTRQSLNDTFNVVSTQSTAKPGCILHLSEIADSEHSWNDILLLHIFNENLTIANRDLSEHQTVVVNDLSEELIFCENYFIVMIIKSANNDFLRTWSLKLSSQAPIPIKDFDQNIGEHSPNANEVPFYRPASPISLSAAKLNIDSCKIYDSPISLPHGVRVVSAVASAGHLPSSSLYPACRAPYTLLLACSDDQVRFFRCISEIVNERVVYEWEPWTMIGNGLDSSLEMEGEICSVSSAHSGRFACAFRSDIGSQFMTKAIEVAVFECESSGGVEWFREDTFNLEKQLIHSINSNKFSPILTMEDLKSGKLMDTVKIDWVSIQDGSHVLTIGIAHIIYLFTRVSQNVAQQNIVMMKETETRKKAPLRKSSSLVGTMFRSNRLARWVCIRTLELQSVDGYRPMPIAMSWVRDGLLVVGLRSEMRVYNQWNLIAQPEEALMATLLNKQSKTKNDDTTTGVKSLSLSKSTSMMEQLVKKSRASDITKPMMVKEIMNKVLSTKNLIDFEKDQSVIEAVSEEGLFEAARLANPILPQYHPKQLIEMLNSGKTKRVKAILLHVLQTLKRRHLTVSNPLSRAASIRRLHSTDDPEPDGNAARQKSIHITFEEEGAEYDELQGISPLPLYALLDADNASLMHEKATSVDKPGQTYDSLFNATTDGDSDLDDMLDEMDDETRSKRSRSSSITSEYIVQNRPINLNFAIRHNRALTELLTHTHLPGLSSVDQMHLLAIADTLSHFSSNVMDKLTQANAALQPAPISTLGDSAAAGYANPSVGVDTVDECGLRFLMAMKQHEYLLLCLPPKQRQALRARGMATSHIIWAFHSDTEMELLNAIPCVQKSTENWDELRSFGVAWWLKNTATLKICVEKMAKNSFQKDQNPMDASLYYLALKKKNVLAHLFRTVQDKKMEEFFRNDFNEDFWRKAALKNAFVLMGKQRYHHAAAFFLLGGSLKDAIKTITARLNDIQLAIVVLRVYEPDRQAQLMEELLCQEVLGMPQEDLRRKSSMGSLDDFSLRTNGDPFERSMAYWILKEYSKAAGTLVEEASQASLKLKSNFTESSLSDIFNFYSFLRKHPLVVRQRLNEANIQIGSTEKFLALAKELENQVTPSERRLYFRTASMHMAFGCPLLALDVLSKLPSNLSIVMPNESISTLNQEFGRGGEIGSVASKNASMEIDWAAPSNVVDNNDLKLDWDEENENDEDDEKKVESRASTPDKLNLDAQNQLSIKNIDQMPKQTEIDFMAQHLKFIASLRIMVEELSTLASGYEVDGGQLRYELFKWLEREFDVLKRVCDYKTDLPIELDALSDEPGISFEENFPLPLHEALSHDRVAWNYRIKCTIHRRKWLTAHQKLIRTLVSYCALHSAQNYRLISVHMELLLLLLEAQQELVTSRNVNDPIPDIHSFPLLMASFTSTRMFVMSPLHFLENQRTDLLLSVIELNEPPDFNDSLYKIYRLFNLCQGLSSCLYQSLSDTDNFAAVFQDQSGALTKRIRTISVATDDLSVMTLPPKWPGVDSIVALIARQADEEMPNLRLLVVECFVAIVMSLFCYAFSVYDSRWLYRLAAHEMNSKSFGLVFGGGGEKRLRSAPSRPPNRPRNSTSSSNADISIKLTDDSAAIRAKLHAKVFGTEHAPPNVQKTSPHTSTHNPASEQLISCWVPPRVHIVQFFADKPAGNPRNERNEVIYDSDDATSEDEYDRNDEFEDEEPKPHDCPTSYAWLLLRLTSIIQIQYRIKQFISIVGFDLNDISSLTPRIDCLLQLLASWVKQIEKQLDQFPGGCPSEFLPHMQIEQEFSVQNAPLLRKYRVLIESGNTPFEYDDKNARPVKRLWTYLVRQENLSTHFIKYIFGRKDEIIDAETAITGSETKNGHTYFVKIIHREHEPIMSFACNAAKPNWIVVSTGREIQEIVMDPIFDCQNKIAAGLNNRVELDIALEKMVRDPIRDNDDYQLIIDEDGKSRQQSLSYKITPFIVDRSRVALKKLRKRTFGGVRRLESHPTLPNYVSGASDGSIYLWEWGAEQPVFTARAAGQYAKVNKLSFSHHGNKFAAVDGDGLLCIWNAAQSAAHRKPFFSQKCHTKVASDVKFLGQTSTLLVTVGNSSGDQNVILWDTLMPQAKVMVHSFVGHSDGATCVAYLPHTQTIASGGRHGEICLWDIRQRQLRSTIKAFESTSVVKSLCVDSSSDLLIGGSSDGDIKIWNTELNPLLLQTMPGEHVARGGFSLRQVGSSLQGVQQLFVDPQLRLFSCGADCSLKFRPISNETN